MGLGDLGRHPRAKGRLAGFMLVNDDSEDELGWSKDSSGIVSISFSYNLIYNNAGIEDDPTWTYIWKMKIPNKMRTLLWPIYHTQLCVI